MANGVLSSYFETDRAKAAKKAVGGVSAYSAPADTGGAPAGGGGGAAPSAPAAAPKGSAAGGTGFVSFGQYFGANAPAIQAQAQKTVEQAKGSAAPSGVGQFQFVGARPSLTRQSVGSMVQQLAQPKQTDPFARQIAQAEKQSAGLEQAARYGDMGEGTSAFDQLLGGGVTQRAAKQEQQRLGTLRAALEGEQAQYQKEQAAQAEAQKQSQAQAQAKQSAYAEWKANLPTQYRYNNTEAELQAMFEDEWTAGTYKEKTPGMVSTPASAL